MIEGRRAVSQGSEALHAELLQALGSRLISMEIPIDRWRAADTHWCGSRGAGTHRTKKDRRPHRSQRRREEEGPPLGQVKSQSGRVPRSPVILRRSRLLTCSPIFPRHPDKLSTLDQRTWDRQLRGRRPGPALLGKWRGRARGIDDDTRGSIPLSAKAGYGRQHGRGGPGFGRNCGWPGRSIFVKTRTPDPLECRGTNRWPRLAFGSIGLWQATGAGTWIGGGPRTLGGVCSMGQPQRRRRRSNAAMASIYTPLADFPTTF